MQKSKDLGPKTWDIVPRQIITGVHCRVVTPIHEARNAIITRVQRNYRTIEVFGQLLKTTPEELLAKIDITKNTGKMQITAADGLIVTWSDRKNLEHGSLMTFPRRETLARA